MTAVRAKDNSRAGPRGELRGIQVTERDVEILQFINSFGFCEMPQLEVRFGWKKPRNYQIVKRLINAGLLVHEKIFNGRHGIYRVTTKGAGYTDLPALNRINLNNYNHLLAITGVYLHLRKKYPNAEYYSERELIQESAIGKSGHMPDGILYLPDGGEKDQKIAIEVELRSKAKARLASIIKWYTSQFDFAEVWYFCPERLANAIKVKLSENHKKFIKVFSLREITS